MKALINELIALVGGSDNKIRLLDHNGEPITKYPTELGWNLIPFPMEKGIPYNADNLATISRAPFLNDPGFLEARKEAESRWEGTGNKRDISWRLDIMFWAISHALRQWDNESIFVECGSGRGYMASAICSYYKWDESKPKLFLIDSFVPYVPDESGQQKKTNKKSFVYSEGDKDIREYFSKIPNVEIITGFIPEILSKLPDSKIGFLHVDLNNAPAESAALDVLQSKLQTGAVILFDDYGGFGGDSQAKVHEEFVKNMGARILTLPTGQALYFHI